MRPHALLAAAALAVAVPPPAAAFVRSTDKQTGACFYWPTRSIQYRINPTRLGTSPSCGPLSATDAGAARAVEAGFAAWTVAQQACTDLQLTRGPDTSATAIGYAQGGPNENLIVFRGGNCTSPEAASNCFDGQDVVIALTTATYRSSTGELVDADMEFVDWTGGGTGTTLDGHGRGWYFTCSDPAGQAACSDYGQSGCFYMDLQNTATHEAGHFIGFAHNGTDLDSTMAPTASIGEVKKSSLTADDVTGLCTVYPKAAPALVCVSQPLEKHGGGCASGGGAGVLGLLALLALKRRRAGQA